ncbi:ATP-binding cassette domain-containing protein [Nocardioides sp. Y6]|uniref:ATP-binding cassette domain-containing protein n=1 Tax=Nocardioides malaquae TaxID=2773426 RepID=A0ABR9RU43_9ACTN|nr:ATP-binding cassette domain-containing protein [Nocardioides malaquae]MBE7325071.1 ATP-binding cassette domain-containing protein [Nocardioides malaquae]
MIALHDITFGYEGRRVLTGVDLEVEEGEFVLLAGPTGSGKSTLLGVVTGLVPTYTGGTLRGDVTWEGESILHQPARERAGRVGFVGQNPAAWFVTDTVEEELAYAMEQLGLPPATMRRRVEDTLDLLGIADLRHRDLRTLSGGEQQRVAIGSVLTMHPRLLVLDEPTSALDPTAAEDVLATLTRLVHDLGVSVLVAEHRIERVVPFADRMVLLRGDGSVEVDVPQVVLERSPIAPPLVDLGRAAGWSPLPLTVREARRRAASLRTPLRDALTHVATTPVDAQAPVGAPVLAARRLRVAHGQVPVLDGVDVALHRGQVTALMGRNGAGKSTLLWALQGRLGRSAGIVDHAGRDPHALPADERRRLTGMVPQTAADLLYLETVAQECEAADAAAGERGTCRGLLDRLAPGITPETHPRDLSEGQKLALAVAVVLTTRPEVLLLDEPTRGLDYPGKEALSRILRDLAAEGHAVMVATHDVEFVALTCDRVVVLADGEVVSDGPTREVVAQSPSFAPQVTKVLGAPWLKVCEVTRALEAVGA